jgi:phage terminase Nu1 subunit (DNA packaging protein)
MQKRTQSATFASTKIVQSIASKTGEIPRSVKVERVAQQDVNYFVSEILKAQKSSRKAVMVLD